MTYGELKRRLRRLGIIRDAQRKRHELWYNPKTDRYSYIPRHKGEVPTGTLAEILADLGITREEFQR